MRPLQTFSANVRTTQRADSMRNIFCRMSCRTMNLSQSVVIQATERMQLEKLEDVCCNHNSPPRASRNSAMLKQTADIYTSGIFRLFQDEMVESLSSVMNVLCSDERLYKLIEEDQNGGSIVQFSADKCTATCSCKMFESMGWLCCHALRVLNLKDITKLPARCILKRWTKGARRGITFLKINESSFHSVNWLNHWFVVD